MPLMAAVAHREMGCMQLDPSEEIRSEKKRNQETPDQVGQEVAHEMLTVSAKGDRDAESDHVPKTSQTSKDNSKVLAGASANASPHTQK